MASVDNQQRPNTRSNQFSKLPTMNTPHIKITILVVDDDSTSLTIVSAMLRGWRYEVASVKSPIDALSTLRRRRGFDLVVTDLHMPQMNGIQLQKQINREFKLPVVIMSSDDKESVMLKSLAAGAVFFIVKPVNPDELKNIWQYAIAAKKGKSVVIEEVESIEREIPSPSAGKLSKAESSSVSSSVKDDKKKKTKTKNNDNNDNKTKNNDNDNNGKRGRKRKKGNEDDEEEETGSATKKAKVVWTSTLHNLFLDALRHIGLEKAVPKRILQHMNVQGLTRENVASHLQKYRMFLKRIAERTCFSSKALIERMLKSSFASGHPLLLQTALEYTRMRELQQMRGSSYQAKYGAHNTGLGSILFPDHQNIASSSNFAAQPHKYRQTSLFGNQANKQQVSGNTSLLPYQGNHLGFANRSNLSLSGGLSGGLINASNGLMNGATANSMQAYPQQFQARPDFYNAGSSSQFRFGSPAGLHFPNPTLGTAGNFGSVSSSFPTLNSGCTNNNSYTGFRMTNDGRMGQTTSFDGGYGSMNGIGNESNWWPAGGNRGVTGYNSNHLMNNASNLGNVTPSQQLGYGFLSDLLLESNNQTNQQQAIGDGTQNPEFSMFPEIYPTLEELLNTEFSESLSLDDNSLSTKQALEQVQKELEDELMKTSDDTAAYPSDESNPTYFNQNIIQQQFGGDVPMTDSELSSIFNVDNASTSGASDSSDNQNWGDDFVDSLFSFGPHFG